MAKRKAVVKMTFAVTFEVPKGMSIADAREIIRENLKGSDILPNNNAYETLKVSLTNKETSYA